MSSPGQSEKQRQGQLAEDRALDYLARHGLILVQRNFSCKGGEIDLIMRQREVLVFVEVRQRAGKEYGGAAASITPAKQRRLICAAQFYLLRLKQLPPCRFDVIAIDAGQLSWLQHAIEM